MIKKGSRGIENGGLEWEARLNNWKLIVMVEQSLEPYTPRFTKTRGGPCRNKFFGGFGCLVFVSRTSPLSLRESFCSRRHAGSSSFFLYVPSV